MTPFHPLFRQALLRDKDHDRLTPDLLDQFETMLAQLYEFESDGAVVGKDKQRLIDATATFQSTFMPNYEAVRTKWAEGQKKNIKGRYRSFNLKDLVVRPFPIFWTWLWDLLSQTTQGVVGVIVSIFKTRQVPSGPVVTTRPPDDRDECDKEKEPPPEDETDENRPGPVID